MGKFLASRLHLCTSLRSALCACVDVHKTKLKAHCIHAPFQCLIPVQAIGATAVGIGRAALFGMAGYGQEGVEKTLEILQDELFTTMQMCGAANLQEIVPEMVQGTDQVAQWSWPTTRDHLPPFNIQHGSK